MQVKEQDHLLDYTIPCNVFLIASNTSEGFLVFFCSIKPELSLHILNESHISPK